VDYLKIRGLLLKQIKHKISDDVYNVLCSQLQVTKGKEASKSRREEKKKKALRLEREGNRR
jgi:translation initiation factor IF-2